MNRKQILRKQIIEKIQNSSLNDKKKWSKAIFKSVINQPSVKQAHTIGFYYAMTNEVATKEMISYFLKQQKQICLPKITVNNQMEMIQINSLEFSFQQKNGFIEPMDNSVVCLKEKIDCMIIPGLAFDCKNNRLGRGQGHYDKYLKEYKGDIIMIVFEVQKVVNLPTQIWDVKMPIIITERSIYKV